MYTSKDISVIFQGPLYEQCNCVYFSEHIKKILPKCELIYSTNDFGVSRNIDFFKKLYDKVVLVRDLGQLPPLKFDKKVNNINRQISTCLSGINVCSRPLVLRLRTDQIIMTNKILEFWNFLYQLEPSLSTSGKGRILTSSIFSINPRYLERLPYHISDMLQFGYKEDLLKYFSCPYYPFEYSLWYNFNNYKAHSNIFEKKFRSRYAVEQWLTMNYIFNGKNIPISFHNDFSDSIINNFESEMIDNFIPFHPEDIDLYSPKFMHMSWYYNLFCYNAYDWKILQKNIRKIDVDFKFLKIRGATKKITKDIYSWRQVLLENLRNIRHL